MNIND